MNKLLLIASLLMSTVCTADLIEFNNSETPEINNNECSFNAGSALLNLGYLPVLCDKRVLLHRKDWLYVPKDTGFEVSKINGDSFSLESMHIQLTKPLHVIAVSADGSAWPETIDAKKKDWLVVFNKAHFSNLSKVIFLGNKSVVQIADINLM